MQAVLTMNESPNSPTATLLAPVDTSHYENFPVASWLCPPHLRAPIAAIYAFARTADDLADEGDAPAQQRLDDLELMRQDLLCAARGQAGSARFAAVFEPLGRVIQQWQVPVPLLLDLLSAFTQDVIKTRDGAGYATYADLLAYCRLSANPVGRLLLHLYGIDDDNALALSDDICTALQLINFWQDLGLDIQRGRYYLTTQDCAAHEVNPADLLALKQTENATKLIAACACLARVLMINGSKLALKIPGRAGWELRLVVQGGLRILEKIEALNFATLTQRPKITARDAPLLFWRALWM
jgi:hydroxysqualene synthase